MRAFGLAATMLTAGPHDSLVRQPVLCLMGQCELIVQILRYMNWANVSIRLGSHHTNCRPMRRFRAAAHCVLDGPMRANCHKSMVHAMGPCGCLGTGVFRLL